MKIKNKITGYILLLNVALSGSIAEASMPKLGTLPIVMRGNETVLLVDGNEGELISFAVLDEPAAHAAVSSDNSRFFVQTRHYLYEGDVKSGEIVKKLQYMKMLEKQPGELVDPNQSIAPLGITSSGKAVYTYNKEMREMLLNKQAGSPQFSEIVSKQPTFMVDVATGVTKHINDYQAMKHMILLVDEKGVATTWKPDTNTLSLENLITGEVKTVDGTAALAALREKTAGMRPYVPQYISDELMYYPFIKQGDGIAAIYDIKNNEVVHWQEAGIGISGQYPLFYKDTDRFFLGDLDCDIGPMPEMPKFEAPKNTSSVDMSEWREQLSLKQTAYTKALNKWQEKASNPDYCSVSIYADKEQKSRLVTIEGTAEVYIYKNQYALAKGGFGVTLYNLDNGSQVWHVDADF